MKIVGGVFIVLVCICVGFISGRWNMPRIVIIEKETIQWRTSKAKCPPERECKLCSPDEDVLDVLRNIQRNSLTKACISFSDDGRIDQINIEQVAELGKGEELLDGIDDIEDMSDNGWDGTAFEDEPPTISVKPPVDLPGVSRGNSTADNNIEKRSNDNSELIKAGQELRQRNGHASP